MRKTNKNYGASLKPKTEGQKNYLREIIENDVTFCTGPAGSGKAQPLDSLVYTKKGPVKIGALKVGDFVLNPDGGESRIIAIHPQGIKDVYGLSFNNGQYVEACKEHLWAVESPSRQWKQTKVVNTEYIINNYKTKLGRNNFCTPSFKNIDFNYQNLPIDPYLLGVILGDGGITSTSIVITSADSEIISNIKNVLDTNCVVTKYKSKYGYGIKSKENHNKNPLIYELRSLNLFGKGSCDKFIPEVYKYGSFSDRLSLLQGLMDTDGYVGVSKKTSISSIEYSTCSKKLSKDVQELVYSLGGTCKITEKMGSYRKNGIIKKTRTQYRCLLKFDNGLIPFRLSRKIKRIKNRTKYHISNIIKDVSYVGKKECVCISLDSKNQLYITNDFIVTHNSFCALGLASQHLLEGKVFKIVVVRPSVEASERGLGYIKGSLAEKLDVFVSPAQEHLKHFLGHAYNTELLNENIKYEALEYCRGKTFDHSFILLDEAQNCTKAQLIMLITRIGEGSKVVICGDTNQFDLRSQSNEFHTDFEYVVQKVKNANLDRFGAAELGEADIVRHPIIGPFLRLFQ